MTIVWTHTVATPDGPFTIITDAYSVICSGWTDELTIANPRAFRHQGALW